MSLSGEGTLSASGNGNAESLWTLQFLTALLASVGLDPQEIRELDLEELRKALQRIDELLEDPAANLRLGIPEVSKERQNRVLKKLLLDRKSLVLGQISLLRKEQDRSDVDSLAEVLKRSDSRDRAVEAALQEFSEKLGERQKEDKDIQAEIVETEKDMREAILFDLELKERKTAMYRTWIERESIASILGALLLVALATVMIIAMFRGTEPTQIITSAFLLILGYFFGTATTKGK